MFFSKLHLVAVVVSFSLLFGETENKDNDLDLNLYARSAVLMDADSGRILYGKEEEEIMANASTTKILTCIVALEMGNLEDYVCVSKQAAKMPKVHLGMQSGQYFRLEDLLYSMMLESHNDSAVAIAEHIGESVENFSMILNQKAQSIGCENTYFLTPNGLDAVEGEKFHSTTAEDLAKMMSYCVLYSPMKEKFLKICQRDRYTFSDYKPSDKGYIQGNRNYQCYNKNAFLTMMDGVLAGKTGFTGKAGYCYVTAMESEERTFVVSLLACGWPNNKTYKWSDTQKLFAYGMENFHYKNLTKQVEITPISVINAIPYGLQEIPVYLSDNEGELLVLLSENDRVETKVYLPKKVNAPVEVNQVVGKMEYVVNEEVVKTCEIRTKAGVKEHCFSWSLSYVVDKWFL